MKSLSEPVEETEEFLKESAGCLKMFENWNEVEQVTFVENLLSRMCHYQHGQVNTFLKPMLQRDFISALPGRFCVNTRIKRDIFFNCFKCLDFTINYFNHLKTNQNIH